MAEEITIPGTTGTAKLRSPWAAALLPIVTLGIYAIFWYYFINREMRDYGKANNTDELGESPGMSVVAVTIGALIIVPAVISVINTFKRIQTAQRMAGIEPQANGWLGLVMALLISPVFYAYEQSELNKVWRNASASAAPAPPAPEPAS